MKNKDEFNEPLQIFYDIAANLQVDNITDRNKLNIIEGKHRIKLGLS